MRHERLTVAMALAESAPQGMTSTYSNPRGQNTASAAGKRPGVLKEPEPQGEIARVRMTEVSGLPQRGYLPQLHGDEIDAAFIKDLMAGTWDYSRLVEPAGPQARDSVPQLAAQFVDVLNVDTPALQVVEVEEVLYSQHSMLIRLRDGEWQVQGRRSAKLLFHWKIGKVWFVMRQEETMNIVSNFDVADVLSHTELVPRADLNAWCWQAIDCSEREPKAVSRMLISVSEELAAKFENAFDMARLISRATDHGERSGRSSAYRPCKRSRLNRDTDRGRASATDHGEIVAAMQTYHRSACRFVRFFNSSGRNC